MDIFVLDGKKMTDQQTAHEYIAKTLNFPDYYGKNLDALADCLGEFGRSKCIVLENENDLKKQLGVYARRLIGVFEDASSEPGAFSFVTVKDE